MAYKLSKSWRKMQQPSCKKADDRLKSLEALQRILLYYFPVFCMANSYLLLILNINLNSSQSFTDETIPFNVTIRTVDTPDLLWRESHTDTGAGSGRGCSGTYQTGRCYQSDRWK